MKKIYLISSSILIVIGILHSVFGIISAKAFNSEILWFISTGLLLVILGLTNLTMALQNVSGFNLRGIQIFNLFGASFVFLLVLADPMAVGFLAFLAQVVNSFGSWNIIRRRLSCCNKLPVNN